MAMWSSRSDAQLSEASSGTESVVMAKQSLQAKGLSMSLIIE